MQLYRLVFEMYAVSVKIARATRLTGLMRRSIGPPVGRLVSKLSPNATRPLEINGHQMFLAAAGSYPPIDMALGRYEVETTRLFERILKPEMVVIDVGGHVGYFSLLAARLVGPQGKVFTFEPEPTNYRLLLENIGLNGYQNIVAVNSAVSSALGTMDLYLAGLDNGRHSAYRHGLPESGRIVVDTTTLDDFLQGEGWPRVDLVKIDVEGGERDVLDGMRQTFERSGGLKLILEFNPSLLRNAGVNPAQFLSRLAGEGFRVQCIDDRHGLISVDATGVDSLVQKLLETEGSVNLFCMKE